MSPGAVQRTAAGFIAGQSQFIHGCSLGNEVGIMEQCGELWQVKQSVSVPIMRLVPIL